MTSKYFNFPNSCSDFFVLSNIQGERIGLRTTIWVSHKIPFQNACLRLFNDYSQSYKKSNVCSVSISDDPRIVGGFIGQITNDDMTILKKFIVLNKEALLDFWNSSEDDVIDLVPNLKKVIFKTTK